MIVASPLLNPRRIIRCPPPFHLLCRGRSNVNMNVHLGVHHRKFPTVVSQLLALPASLLQFARGRASGFLIQI